MKVDDYVELLEGAETIFTGAKGVVLWIGKVMDSHSPTARVKFDGENYVRFVSVKKLRVLTVIDRLGDLA